MSSRAILPAVLPALILASPAAAQQRVDRFPDADPPRVARQLIVERESYWLEGAAIGASAGIGWGLMYLEDGGVCTLSVPGGSCESDGARAIGTALLGIGGAFLGGMIGASISRE